MTSGTDPSKQGHVPAPAAKPDEARMRLQIPEAFRVYRV